VRTMAEEIEESALELGIKSANIASFVSVAQASAILINSLTLIAAARLLGPNDYGLYTLGFGVASLFLSLSGISVGYYLHKRIPELLVAGDRKGLKEIVGDSLFLVAACSIVAMLVGFALGPVISSYAFHSASYTGLVDLALLSVVFSSLFNLEYSMLIALRSGKGAAAMFIAYNLLLSGATLGLIYLGYGVFGAIAAMTIGTVAGMIAGYALILKRVGISFAPRGIMKRIRGMLDFSIPLTVSGMLGGFVSNFSVLLLGIFTTATVVGTFGVAYRIGSGISIMLGFVGTVLIQMFSSAMAGRRSRSGLGKLYNYSIYFSVLITAPIAAFLLAFPGAFVSSIFPSYQAATIYIPALSVCLMLGIVGGSASSLAISRGKISKIFKYWMLISVVEFLLMLALVPFIGAYGVIIGLYFTGSMANNYIFARYLKREMGIDTKLGGSLRIVLASALLTALLLPINLIVVSSRVQTVQLIIGAVAVFALYPPLLVLTGAVRKREMALLTKISQNIEIFGKPLALLIAYASLFRPKSGK
jgi:O-antigen/teichoic acid export membrane protein